MNKVAILTVVAIVMTIASNVARAVPLEMAKEMCNTFANNHPEEDRAKFISRCMSTLTVDPPALTVPTPAYSTGVSAPDGKASALLRDVGHAFTSVWLLIAIAVLYFVPTVVAITRRKIDRLAIFF